MTLPTALVTGGAKRIGAAISRAFADAGYHVVIHYNRSHTEADALAATLPSAQTIGCDLLDAEAAAAMVRQLADTLPDWRVLVNNAGIFAADAVTALDPETNQEAMQINAATPALMAQTFLTAAKSAAGRRVIHLTDQKLANSNPDFFSYTMSKHALSATIAMLAKGACGPHDRVYGLAPGAILPSHDQTPAETEKSHRMNLLQRKTGPSEVAAAAVFLADGWLANGETLFVDSGQHLLQQDRDVIYLARQDGTST
ncbi:Pteridine reductase [Alteripontixanthobacter maritimus]|uniref:Pteridine reductase n=1 Tax=Alteripontixanthobacter maritimus TaxID=2161824 RepID=A0A369QBD6_9SPHN|nr:Pteridine reductase [Alteripontixanthobacter maritimus]